MTNKLNVLNVLHPNSFLNSEKVRVIEFNNRFDLLAYLAKTEPVKSSVEYTEEFNNNIKSLNLNADKVRDIKNEVMNKLIKRGIVTGTIYEGYKYDVDGDIIDHAVLASGNPNCMMKPVKKYDKWFYELYINMSVPGRIQDSEIETGAIRLVETIKALEERHIEIKVNIIDYSKNLYYQEEEEDLLVVIPLMSHLDTKTHENLVPYVLGSFLRGPLFTIARNSIENKGNVSSGMGSALTLSNAVNLWGIDESFEVALAERILGDLDLL